MEPRNITLTLEKAREWYNSDSADLKEIALQAYTKDELEIPKWQNIKTFEDACRALDMSTPYVKVPPFVDVSISNHLYAICKLDIIRKALNRDWEPSLVQDNVYYPCIMFYSAGHDAKEVVSKHKEWKLGESFIVNGKKYTLVGGYSYSDSGAGLASFSLGYGDVRPYLGLLGCKNSEIAEHMSRYFSKEIFEATYTHHIGTYQWI